MRFLKKMFKMAFVVSALLFKKHKDYKSLRICGNTDFIEKVENSLNLLREKSPKSYSLILRNLNYIIQGKASGAVVIKPSAFIISNSLYQQSYDILASCIAHDAYHCELFIMGEEHTGEKAEKKCLDYQIAVLKELGASEYILNFYQNEAMKTRWWEVPYGDRK